MNYETQDYYDELYRIFSCVDTLLTPSQTMMLGECLRSLAAGENISYKLERLYRSVEGNSKLAEPLENFMHHYIIWVAENDIKEDDPDPTKEEKNNVYSEKNSISSSDYHSATQTFS